MPKSATAIVPAARKRRASRKPLQARAAATRASIVEAAASVLSRRGYAGTTTNHIAARAGVSIGTLYEYFRNKEQVVAAVLEAHLAEGEALVASHAERIPPDLLQRPVEALLAFVVTTFVEVHEHDPALHRVLSSEVPRTKAMSARVVALEARIVDGLAAMLALHPETACADVGLAARICVQTIDALVHRWIIDRAGAPIPAPRLTAELVVLLSAYVRSAG